MFGSLMLMPLPSEGLPPPRGLCDRDGPSGVPARGKVVRAVH